MPRNKNTDRKSIFTFESMYLMSASASDIDVDPNSEIDPGVGPLPGLDFPADLLIAPEDFEGGLLDLSEPAGPESIEMPGAVSAPANSTASLEFLYEGAGYRNTVGTYLVDEATGEISDVKIAFGNASFRNSGGDLVRGDSVDVMLEEGKQIGFFLLADGSGRNNIDAIAGSELSFEQRPDGSHRLVATMENGREVRLRGPLYVSDASMNPRGLDHFKIESHDKGFKVQIEDLPNLGDNDFDDVVVNLNFEIHEPEVVAPEFASLDDTATFIEGMDAVVLDADVSLNELPADSLNGATLTLNRTEGASENDVFSGSGTLGDLTEGAELTVDGATIGRVSANSNGTLELTFNENATTELVNAAMQQVAYSNTADYLSGEAHFDWTFATADGSTTEGCSSIHLIDSDRIYVTTAEREVDGDTSSIAALIQNNGGTGISLEEAIIAANNTRNIDGADEIFFNIAGDGVHVIEGAGQPNITEAVTIDASTEAGFVDRPLIVMDGNDAKGNGFTITATADGTEIRGFNIRDFAGNGIHIQKGAEDNTIANNWIGRFANDGSDAGLEEQNGGAGILISGADNYIGGMSASEANVISGNYKQGIRITGEDADYNVIHGNLIGTDLDGSIDVGNRWAGIRVDNGADDTVIGGTQEGAGNILSGNGTYGVRVTGEGTVDTTIQGNLIGTDHSGTEAMGNDINGVLVDRGAEGTTIGGSEDGAGNVISANGTQGVRVSGEGTDFTVIQGNVIGTNADGNAALGNRYAGILIDAGAGDTVVGGDWDGAANILSGNGTHGVRVTGDGTVDTTIQGNLIGTDDTGSEAIGNAKNGVRIDSGAAGTTVGGSTEQAGNVVSGNGTQGVLISGEDTSESVVQGNVIGTDSDGVFALGNRFAGILINAGAHGSVIGGAHDGAENIISGNGTHGVRITGAGTNDNTVQGNLIGTDHTANVAIGNARVGVKIDNGAQENTIGGIGEDDGNVIAASGGDGVRIVGEGTDRNVVQGNYVETADGEDPHLANGRKGIHVGGGAQDNVIDCGLGMDAAVDAAAEPTPDADIIADLIAALNEQLPMPLTVVDASFEPGVDVESGATDPEARIVLTAGVPNQPEVGEVTFVLQRAEGFDLPIDLGDFVLIETFGFGPIFEGQGVFMADVSTTNRNSGLTEEESTR